MTHETLTRPEQTPLPEPGNSSNLDKTVEQKQTKEAAGTHREELAWEHYTPIGSAEYEQANQKRIADGKIKIVKIGDGDKSITLIASVKIDPETGQAISGHENRPGAESMRDTEAAFADYLASTPPEKRFVVYEGDERLFTDRDEAISQATDSGLVQYLAARERIPTISGEPTEAEAVDVMERLGVSREELLALYVARGLEAQTSRGEADFLAGYINYHAATLGIEGFHDFSEAEKQAIVEGGQLDELRSELNRKTAQILPTLNELYKPILDDEDLLVVVDGNATINPEFASNVAEITMDKLGWSGEYRLNEVAKLSMEMRDRVIFRRILEAYNSDKNPFVVYGGSHVVTLEPALKTYVSDLPQTQAL